MKRQNERMRKQKAERRREGKEEGRQHVHTFLSGFIHKELS